MNKTTNRTSPATLTPPITFRLPRVGTTDPFFGCARTFWNARVLPNAGNNFKPPIRSVVVAQPGAKRGVRLIVFASARSYVEELAASQAGELA